jgi:hypothetical protein
MSKMGHEENWKKTQPAGDRRRETRKQRNKERSNKKATDLLVLLLALAFVLLFMCLWWCFGWGVVGGAQNERVREIEPALLHTWKSGRR